MPRNRFNSGNTPEEELPKAKINKESIKKAEGLLAYMKPYRLKFFSGLAFLFVSSFVFLVIPALMGAMLDAAQGKHKLPFINPGINALGFTALGVLFIQAIVSFFRVRFFVEVAEKTTADIRRDTYFKLITLPMDFFANRRVGELNSRLSADLSQIQDTITTTLAEIIRQSVMLVGGIIILIVVSKHLTLFNLSVLPVVVICAVLFGKRLRNVSRKAQDKLADSNIIVHETLQGISNVKAFANEAYETKRYQNSLKEVISYALKGATLRGAFASFIVFCLLGTIVGVVWYGSTLVENKELTPGLLSTYILYSAVVGAAMGTFPDLFANLQKTLGASERVIEILNEENEPISTDAEQNATKQIITGTLEFDNVHFSYPSRKEVQILKGLSFKVNAGEKIAIVGPSGAGKSTIASLILSFYQPQEGDLLLDGQSYKDFALTDIRNQVAIVPQDVLLFGGTIKENITYGKLDATEDEIIAAAKQANAHSFIDQLPEKYETIVGERGIKLSGGQRQRIAIARALLKDPSILILDEATSSLDSESERLVQEALEILMKNRTSIIIAHRLSTIREADKIIVLEKGRVAEMGTHEELIQNEEGLYRYLNQLQFDA